MEKIPTAEEFLEQYLRGDRVHDDINRVVDEDDAIEAMIEFAKLHVEAALKAASEKALMEEDWVWNGEEENRVYTGVDKDSILNSYSLDKIK